MNWKKLTLSILAFFVITLVFFGTGFFFSDFFIENPTVMIYSVMLEGMIKGGVIVYIFTR